MKLVFPLTVTYPDMNHSSSLLIASMNILSVSFVSASTITCFNNVSLEFLFAIDIIPYSKSLDSYPHLK